MIQQADHPLPSGEPSECRFLGEIAPRTPFWKGTVFGTQDAACANLYIIVRGQVLLSRRGLEGDDYSAYLLGPGDLFGEGSLQPDRTWQVTAKAVTDGAVHVLPSAQLPRFIRYYPELGAHVVRLLSSRLVRSHRRLDLVTSNCARERVMGLLRVMADYHGQSRNNCIWLPVPITQTELAEMVGLARETVARTLSTLEVEGVIRREGRRGFWLRDEEQAEPSAPVL